MALSLSRGVVSVQQAASSRRVPRYPSHTFHLRYRPYVIQPFAIAPVLPGETLKLGLLQTRTVTDPIRNGLIGWWLEHYLFYVKLRDLPIREEMEKMAMDPEWSKAAIDETAASTDYYFYGGSAGAINWQKLCLQRVVEEYFRNEGEAWDAYTIGGMPIASISEKRWHDTLYLGAAEAADDVDVDLDADSTITASEIDRAMAVWQMQRAMNLTDMTYEDWLRTYGVRVPQAEELHKPELLRNLQQWQYPTNHIEPTTGAPSSAVSWSIGERIDKDRFFREPGFIFGVTVCRPKVYWSNQLGAAASAMDGMLQWLPAVLNDDPNTSLRYFAQGQGPLPGLTDAGGYWMDVRDLLVYGDQFINFAMADELAAAANLVDLPVAATGQRRYPSQTDVFRLFTAGGGSPTGGYVKSDGILNLTIMGRQVDMTPSQRV